MILNKEIEVLDWEKDIKTSQGKGMGLYKRLERNIN